MEEKSITKHYDHKAAGLDITISWFGQMGNKPGKNMTLVHL